MCIRDRNDTELFRPLYNSLLNTQSTSKADTYFILADFKAYAEAQRRVEAAYRDEKNWAKSAILNVASAGKFSSDRTIEEYVEDVYKRQGIMLVRMYMLLGLLVLAATWLHVKSLQERKRGWRFYAPLAVLVYLGFLTHYYFAVYLFFLAAAMELYPVSYTHLGKR